MMEKQPLVSIIIPVYNASAYLRCCLDSVISQTYKNIEIILVDDGSTDDSGKICDEYAGQDGRIKVFHQENGGQALARNNAIKHVNGSFILYADSDDILTTDHVEYFVTLSNKYNADLVQCEMIKFRDENQILTFEQQKENQERIDEELYNAQEALKQFSYQRKFTASPWGKLIKKELMDKLEFPVGVGYEDMAIMFRLIGTAEKLVYSSKICYYYRQHQNSTMHTKFSDKKVDRIRIVEQFFDYIKQNYPDNIVAAHTRYDLAQLQLLMELPFGREYRDIKKAAYSNLKKTRKVMLQDQEAPKRLKLMVRASYLGPSVLMLLGRAYMIVTNR